MRSLFNHGHTPNVNKTPKKMIDKAHLYSEKQALNSLFCCYNRHFSSNITIKLSNIAWMVFKISLKERISPWNSSISGHWQLRFILFPRGSWFYFDYLTITWWIICMYCRTLPYDSTCTIHAQTVRCFINTQSATRHIASTILIADRALITVVDKWIYVKWCLY